MSLIKKGDLIEVVSGEYKGERGKVLEVHAAADKVVVEGINMRVKHERVRPVEGGGQKGGRTEFEAPIHVSNVMVVDPKTGKPVRIGNKVAEGRKVRVTKGRNSSGSVLE